MINIILTKKTTLLVILLIIGSSVIIVVSVLPHLFNNSLWNIIGKEGSVKVLLDKVNAHPVWLMWSDDGQYLSISTMRWVSSEKAIGIVLDRDGKVVFKSDSYEILSVTIDARGGYIVLGTIYNISLYNINGEKIFTITRDTLRDVHGNPVRVGEFGGVCLSPNGKWILVRNNNVIRIIDHNGRVVWDKGTNRLGIYQWVDPNPWISENELLYIVNNYSAHELHKFNIETRNDAILYRSGPNNHIIGVAYSKEKGIIAIAISGKSNKVVMVDLNNGRVIKEIPFDNALKRVSLSPHAKYLAVVTRSDKLYVMDTHHDRVIKKFSFTADYLSWSSDDSLLVISYSTAFARGAVIVIKADQGEIVYRDNNAALVRAVFVPGTHDLIYSKLVGGGYFEVVEINNLP